MLVARLASATAAALAVVVCFLVRIDARPPYLDPFAPCPSSRAPSFHAQHSFYSPSAPAIRRFAPLNSSSTRFYPLPPAHCRPLPLCASRRAQFDQLAQPVLRMPPVCQRRS